MSGTPKPPGLLYDNLGECEADLHIPWKVSFPHTPRTQAPGGSRQLDRTVPGPRKLTGQSMRTGPYVQQDLVRQGGGRRWAGFPVGAPLLRRWGHGGRTQLRLWGGAHLILPLQEVTLHIRPPALHAQTEAPEGTLEQGRWGWPALSASRPWVPASPSALDCGRLPVCHDRGGDPGEAEGGARRGTVPSRAQGRAKCPCGQGRSNRHWGTVPWCWGPQSLQPQLVGRQIFTGTTKVQKRFVFAEARAAEDPTIHR